MRSMSLSLDIKITGGKNLTKLKPGGRAFITESLKYVHSEILNATAHGKTADGRALEPYSKGYLRSRKRAGLSTTPNLRRSGQMMRSMYGTVTNKQQGAIRFRGDHISAETGEADSVKVKKKDGSEKVRNLTNQMLASILSFRKTGRPMPTRPMNFVPDGRFMDIGKKQADHIMRLYNKYHERQLAGLPPALP